MTEEEVSSRPPLQVAEEWNVERKSLGREAAARDNERAKPKNFKENFIIWIKLEKATELKLNK